jgi:hypothetical protein
MTSDNAIKWELRHVPGEYIRSVWDDVRWCLDEVLTSCPDADTWIPEDVYHEVKSGTAALYVNVGEKIFACLVTQIVKDKNTGQPSLHVWIAFSGKYGAIANLLPEVERLAKNLGIRHITCSSPSEAFSALGFKKKLMMYERQL